MEMDNAKMQKAFGPCLTFKKATTMPVDQVGEKVKAPTDLQVGNTGELSKKQGDVKPDQNPVDKQLDIQYQQELLDSEDEVDIRMKGKESIGLQAEEILGSKATYGLDQKIAKDEEQPPPIVTKHVTTDDENDRTNQMWSPTPRPVHEGNEARRKRKVWSEAEEQPHPGPNLLETNVRLKGGQPIQNLGKGKVTLAEDDVDPEHGHRKRSVSRLDNEGEENEEAKVITQSEDNEEFDQTKRATLEAVCSFNKHGNSSGHRILNKEHFHLDDTKSPLSAVDMGRGSFGDVIEFKGQTGSLLARKKIAKHETKSINPKEILFPATLSHQGIVKVVGWMYNRESFYIYMLSAGYSLYHWVKSEKWRFSDLVTDAQKVQFCLDLFGILLYLDQQGILHRDIKPGNICLRKSEDGKMVLTLIDFGSAQRQDESCLLAHTYEFLPPALNRFILNWKRFRRWRLEQKTTPTIQSIPSNLLPGYQDKLGTLFFDEKCDCYAMAKVIFWCINGGKDFIEAVNNGYKDDLEREKAMEEIMNMTEESVKEILDNISLEPLKELLKNTLCLDGKKRWTAEQCCQHLKKYQGYMSQQPFCHENDTSGKMSSSATQGSLSPEAKRARKVVHDYEDPTGPGPGLLELNVLSKCGPEKGNKNTVIPPQLLGSIHVSGSSFMISDDSLNQSANTQRVSMGN